MNEDLLKKDGYLLIPEEVSFLQRESFSFQKAYFCNVYKSSKTYEYSFECEGKNTFAFLSYFVLREEKDVWESVKSVVDLACEGAQVQIKGFYTLDWIHVGLLANASFDPNNLTSWIVNQSRSMSVGEKRLIRYGEWLGVLSKNHSEDWGKLQVSYPVQTYLKSLDQLDLVLKKWVATYDRDEVALFVVHKLGNEPLFRFGQEPQTERLRKWISSCKRNSKVFILQQEQLIDVKYQLLGDA